MSLNEMVTALVLLPLLGAAITGLFVRTISDKSAQYLTSGCMLLSALLAAFVFGEVAGKQHGTSVTIAPWIHSGTFIVNWALKVDVLTAVMLIVVTWVSAVVHLYSIGYMSHDPHKPRFMCYLSLFTFAMLMLVTADNFIQLFFGWEGVGLCSYLLIGFWFKKPEANAAAMKAFIVNRVGDFGFALGIMAIFFVFGSVQFDAVFALAADYQQVEYRFLGETFALLDVICVLLFIGAMGKSAQLLLHTWLPDAMEGPTPVSALIHAATMVTAGVFMVARCSPLFEYSENALMIVTLVGAFTAFFAATVGLVQNDIKRVIAYSTCSQLGYMFFACGVSAYSAGIFHLMTHAFFKALLFLGAGSVIHAMSDEQDMRNMGGIWKKIPYTYAYMWIGSLALAGLPFFAGYYSKDIILEAAFASHSMHGQIAFWLGIAAALMTAFYSWRLLFLTFHGTPRASKEVMSHIHESPKIMLLPLVLLAGGALFAGFYGHTILGMVEADGHFWDSAIAMIDRPHLVHEQAVHHAPLNVLSAAHHVPEWVPLLPTLVALSGIGLAYLLYIRSPQLPAILADAFRPLYRFLLNKWYFDELYELLFVRNAKRLGKLLWQLCDVRIIDGFGPNGAAWLTRHFAEKTARLQTGYLYHYAFAMLIGLVVLVSLFTFMLMRG